MVLADQDGPTSELIGVVDLTYASLSSVLEQGHGAVVHVDVSGQRQPVLFVGVSVAPEPVP
jgi:hypothetical protein